MADFNQMCIDITLGHDEELIRFDDLVLIFKVIVEFKLQNLSQKKLVCMLSQNHWLECYQICMSILLGYNEELIRFW